MNEAQSTLKRGFLWLGSAAAITRVIDVVVLFFVLTRLSNADVGAASLAWTIAVVLEAGNGLGMSSAVLNARHLPRKTLDTAYWIAAGFGAVSTVVAIAAAPIVAYVYDSPALLPLVAVSGTKLLATSLASVPLQRLNRAMRFGTVASIQVIATLVAASLRLGLAFAGAGAWALVIAQTFHGFAQLIALMVVAPYFPRLHFDRDAARGLIKFGASTIGADGVYQLYRNVDFLLVGRFLGLEALGIYRVVFDVAMEPVMAIADVISRTASRVLCRLSPQDPELSRSFLWTLQKLALALLPVVVVLAVGFEPLLSIIGRDRFAGAAMVSSGLVLAAYVRALALMFLVLLTAALYPQVVFRLALLMLLFLTTTIGLGLTFGSQYGLAPVAFSWLTSVALLFYVALRASKSRGLIEPAAVAKTLQPVAKGALIVGTVGAAALGLAQPIDDARIQLLVIVGVVLVAYTAFLRIQMGARLRDLFGTSTTSTATSTSTTPSA